MADFGLRLFGSTKTAIILLWDALDESLEYILTRDGAEVYRGTDLSYTDHGLTSGKTYSYQLSAGEVSQTIDGTTKTAIELITDRTAEDVFEGRPKGWYSALDLIRVGEAMLYAQGLLDDFGYSVPLKVKLDWQITDIPTHALMRRYIDDVQALRDVVHLLDTTPPAPESANNLTYTGANSIEQILSDIDEIITAMSKVFIRANFPWAVSGGPGFYFAN